jgi:hypothetical protein
VVNGFMVGKVLGYHLRPLSESLSPMMAGLHSDISVPVEIALP